jgi:anti-sigma factor RsiW
MCGHPVLTARDDLHSLTGVYVIDALTDLERCAFERHLRECAPCHREVRELGEAVLLLVAAIAHQPEASLGERVLAGIAG